MRKQPPAMLPSDLGTLEDEALIGLLWTAGDQLPRAVVDEAVRRGPRCIPYLRDIIGDELHWSNAHETQQWAVVHATFILGTIGGEHAVAPLIAALRQAAAAQNDWVGEDLPAIFGSIGPVALEPLRRVATDPTNSWYVRSTALAGMAAITIAWTKYRREVLDVVAAIVADGDEDDTLRGLASSKLMDFDARRYRRVLERFLAEQEEQQRADSTYGIHYDQSDLDRALTSEESSSRLDHYTRDWLRFYDLDEIVARTRRWKREHALWYRAALCVGFMGLVWRWKSRKLHRAIRTDGGR